MKPENATIRRPGNTMVPERRRSRVYLLWCTIAALVWGIPVSASLAGQSSKPTEFRVEAAYIYNFGKFVKWPANAPASKDGSFAICVLGEGPFDSVLQSTLSGELVGSRPVTVKRISKPQDATGCRILFIDSAEKNHLQDILSALGQASVLTVSDMPDFSKRGGMIQFVLEGDRVRFEINRASAEGAGLILASDLLKVAVAVRGTSRIGDQ